MAHHNVGIPIATTENWPRFVKLHKCGLKTIEIAKQTGFSPRNTARYVEAVQTLNSYDMLAAKQYVRKIRHDQVSSHSTQSSRQTSSPREMTPREMIKKLYDMGYRIKNNTLVFIQETEIKLSDIINN